MLTSLLSKAPSGAVPLRALAESAYDHWLKGQTPRVATWLGAQRFKAKAGNFCVVPDSEGRVDFVVVIVAEPAGLWDLAGLPRQLGPGTYVLETPGEPAQLERWALGWMLGAYRFDRYKKNETEPAKLVVAAKVDGVKIRGYAEALGRARDLINMPAEDLGPEELGQAVAAVGKAQGAKVVQIVGDALLKKNYPALHVVGRASSRAPRLIDLRWGKSGQPRVTLVGKGVCFDTGGLDLKPSSAMLTMKKDMGGAAAALAVAELVMARKVPVQLRLLIPAADNAVSGNAFRPLDVIKMRNGQTVEVTNTDAEGRLLLADALAEASVEKPDLLIDFSTLTGAARAAVGPELTALFTPDDQLAESLLAEGAAAADPFWRLPLYTPYASMLDSNVADCASCSNGPYAGATTAALFLQRFVGAGITWAHLDFMAWNLSSKPGRPEGGEAMTVRTVFGLIEKRFGRA